MDAITQYLNKQVWYNYISSTTNQQHYAQTTQRAVAIASLSLWWLCVSVAGAP